MTITASLVTLILLIYLISGALYLLGLPNSIEVMQNPWLFLYTNTPWGWVAESALVVWLLVYLLRFHQQRQGSQRVQIQEDVRECSIHDLIGGVEDSDAELYTDCAILSANVYADADSLALPNWVQVDDNFVFKGWPLEQSNGLKVEVWRKTGGEKIIALVFRGTIGISSFTANFHWLFKFLPYVDQYDQLKILVPELVRAIRESEFADHKIISTGHSLGGGLAQHANYLSAEIPLSIVFNSSPVTGWSDIPRDVRNHNTLNSKVLRMYEHGEVLQFLRPLTELFYLLNLKPNRDPFFSIHRVNLKKAGLVRSHSIHSLAQALGNVRKVSECHERDDEESSDMSKLCKYCAAPMNLGAVFCGVCEKFQSQCIYCSADKPPEGPCSKCGMTERGTRVQPTSPGFTDLLRNTIVPLVAVAGSFLTVYITLDSQFFKSSETEILGLELESSSNKKDVVYLDLQNSGDQSAFARTGAVTFLADSKELLAVDLDIQEVTGNGLKVIPFGEVPTGLSRVVLRPHGGDHSLNVPEAEWPESYECKFSMCVYEFGKRGCKIPSPEISFTVNADSDVQSTCLVYLENLGIR